MENNYQEEIREGAQHVFDVMAQRVDAEEVEKIKSAFEFADNAHRGQMRKSGKPYITHPISVAAIVAEELFLDTDTVCAAFLHDVVEDTPYTVEDIKEKFGENVAFLVDIVTKRKKDKYENTKQVDNYKQILASVKYDPRGLLVKLADRLHNMRTLDSMRPDKQMKIAGETDFFYAPLAGKLGLYHVKSELENLSFRFRCPREFNFLEQKLDEDKQRTEPALKEFMEQVDSILKEKGINARIQVRYRRPYSIWRDMKEAGCDFQHVEFKHYIRIIYTPMPQWEAEDAEKDTALYIYGILARRFKERPGSLSNYIDSPKDNGYQSFHVKFLNRMGTWEEFHIGSERMHVNAKLGCVVDLGESWIERFREILKNIAESNDGFLFMEGLSSSLYNEGIIAFTPKGKGIILPKGSTALDFAFELHTNIGQHAQYCRVNGALLPLRTELHRGDCVEIGVSENITPKPEWLDIVKSYKAKRYLRELLKDVKAPEYVICPICHPLPGDETIGYRGADGVLTLHSRHCYEVIRLASENGDAIEAATFQPDENITFPVRIHITAIDRYHLFRDIIDCFVETRHLSVDSIHTRTEDQIINITFDFPVHSTVELEETIADIQKIRGVDEVKRVDII